MKILHYIPSIDRSSGGIGAYMQLLTRDLGRLCELHVVTHCTDEMLDLENCTLHYITINNNPFSNKSKREFLELLNEVGPDVFHVNCCWLPQSARLAMWAKNRGYRIVYSPHGMLEPWIMKRHYWSKKLPALLLYQRKALEVADIVHATADSEKQNFLNLDWNRRVEVIPNCIQLDGIDIKETWNKTCNILFLSRVHVKKGIEYLIDAVAELRNKFEGYTFIIVGPGEGEYIESLKQKARKKQVENLFYFVGAVFGDKKWQLYKDADLFVLPTYSENFGIVVPESLASGTPVITTHGTPWRELNEEKCGWWIPIGKDSLVTALQSFLLKTPEELKEMGLRGRKLVEDKYSSEKVAKQFLAMYENLISD
jgi:glycosyltransferase involved in cell wall biosynthesis